MHKNLKKKEVPEPFGEREREREEKNTERRGRESEGKRISGALIKRIRCDVVSTTGKLYMCRDSFFLACEKLHLTDGSLHTSPQDKCLVCFVGFFFKKT